MSSKKIEWYAAREIATAVAEKAFEHILTPLRKQANEAALDVYKYELATCGIGLTAHAELMQHVTRERKGNLPGCGACTLRYDLPHDRDQEFTVKAPPNAGFALATLYVLSEKGIADIEAIKTYLQPVEQQAAAMANDVMEQIKGRTVPTVVKAWPEIAPFVYKQLRIDPLTRNTPTPVPFQDLINKHLLALPAPEAPTPVKKIKAKAAK